jgi:hypothetical protein
LAASPYQARLKAYDAATGEKALSQTCQLFFLFFVSGILGVPRIGDAQLGVREPAPLAGVELGADGLLEPRVVVAPVQLGVLTEHLYVGSKRGGRGGGVAFCVPVDKVWHTQRFRFVGNINLSPRWWFE